MELREDTAGGKATTHKGRARLWWLTVFKDAKEYARACDVCQRTGKLYRRDEMPLHPVVELQPFYKWAVGPINPPARHSGARPIYHHCNSGQKQHQLKTAVRIQPLQ